MATRSFRQLITAYNKATTDKPIKLNTKKLIC